MNQVDENKLLTRRCSATKNLRIWFGRNLFIFGTWVYLRSTFGDRVLGNGSRNRLAWYFNASFLYYAVGVGMVYGLINNQMLITSIPIRDG